MMVRVLLGPSSFQRPRRLARPRTPPFHGDNMGSNPIGDTNNIAYSGQLDFTNVADRGGIPANVLVI